jgi:hypothetical protein
VSDPGEITPCWTITFHRTSKHSAERVWNAITNPGFVARWWDRGPARIDVRVGGEYYVDFGDGSSLDGIIVRCEPGHVLAYAWGMSVIEWKIEPDGEGSRYTFVDNGNRPPPEGAECATRRRSSSRRYRRMAAADVALQAAHRIGDEADVGGLRHTARARHLA